MNSISNFEVPSSPALQHSSGPAITAGSSQVRPRSHFHPFNMAGFRSRLPNALDLARQLSLRVEESLGNIESSRKLRGHASCINALTWSSGSEGRWMASGGDDNKVLLWDMYGDLEGPAACCKGPRGNIFALAFNASNSTIFCAGTDERIHTYDVSRLGSSPARSSTPYFWNRAARERLEHHDDVVRAISTHPSNDALFLSCSSDGQIFQYDTRTPANSNRFIDHYGEINDVKYHPLTPDLFLSCDVSGDVWLHDARQAFSTSTSTSGCFASPSTNGVSDIDDFASRRRGVVRQYVNCITKPGYTSLCNPEASSISLDAEGDRFAVTFLQHLPTIYSINDPYPIATVSGKRLPDGSSIPPGERSYSNGCTTKHGSFSPLGTHYTAGSDDFRGYVWKIPPSDWLLERRRKKTEMDWLEEGDPSGTGAPQIGYARDLRDVPVIPVDLSTPSCRLGGHDSIVNTCLIHPKLPIIATSGIESFIRLHRPVMSATSPDHSTDDVEEGWSTGYRPARSIPELSRPERNRAMLLALRESSRDEEGTLLQPAEDEEDEKAIALFDEIIRQEGDRDVFISRRYTRASRASNGLSLTGSGTGDYGMEDSDSD